MQASLRLRCRDVVNLVLSQSVKVRRGRREGDGTENVMTERPSRARWFVLRALTSLTSFPLFCTSEDINGRGGGADKMGLEGRAPLKTVTSLNKKSRLLHFPFS